MFIEFAEQPGMTPLEAVGMLFQGLFSMRQTLFQATDRLVSLAMRHQLGLSDVNPTLEAGATFGVLLDPMSLS